MRRRENLTVVMYW